MSKIKLSTRQDKTRQDKTRQDKTRQDKTRQDKTRQDKTRQDKTRQDKGSVSGLRKVLVLRNSNSVGRQKSAKSGFISVVAMIIFAILVITGLSVQRGNIDRLQNIKNTNNYLNARNITNSALGMLKQEIKSLGAGANLSFECEYRGGNLYKPTQRVVSPMCEKYFDVLVNPCGLETMQKTELCESGYFKNDVKIKAEIIGRTMKEVQNCELGFNGGCYTVPEIGQGTAGNRSLMPVKNEASRDCDLVSESELMADLNHECNWNRLSFGSSSTDRVVIPMYYTNSEGEAVEYHKDLSAGTPHFVLRVRTPCKEWKETDGTCLNRYELDTGIGNNENDIVLQWQITGKCEEGGNEMECGILPWVKFDQFSGVLDPQSSGISEDKINYSFFGSNIVFQSRQGVNLNIIDTIKYKESRLFQKLPHITTPSLILFLNKPLISVEKERIPYLEYQFITPSQISSPEAKIYAEVNFEGNTSSNTVYKSIQGALIDFAIQN